MGIDPGWGSSPFGICIIQFVNSNEIQILYANEFERPDYNEMLTKVGELIQKYNPNKILIDGANPSFIRSLKIQLNENPDYDKVIARYRDKKINWESFAMKVLPINFNQEHKIMLSKCKMLLEDGCIAINPVFDKLVTSLRTAIEDSGMLDKETTSYNDIFDAFRLALRYYKINQSQEKEQEVLV
jgi:Terminase RNaseH-like domain